MTDPNDRVVIARGSDGLMRAMDYRTGKVAATWEPESDPDCSGWGEPYDDGLGFFRGLCTAFAAIVIALSTLYFAWHAVLFVMRQVP